MSAVINPVLLWAGMQARDAQVSGLKAELRAVTQSGGHGRLLICGMGGMGKSTLAEAICHDRQNDCSLRTCRLELPGTQLGSTEVNTLLRRAVQDLCRVPVTELGSLVTTDVS